MVKYIKDEVLVCFSEIPDEIVLAINISNCPHHCKGCHSPYLQQDIGDELTKEILDELIKKNDGITCVCFMGEGNDLLRLFLLGAYIKITYKLKVGIYSGSKEIPNKFWDVFDYIKLGGYKEEFGPLNKETTNQRMYKYDSRVYSDDVKNKPQDIEHYGWRDITYKFWRKDV